MLTWWYLGGNRFPSMPSTGFFWEYFDMDMDMDNEMEGKEKSGGIVKGKFIPMWVGPVKGGPLGIKFWDACDPDVPYFTAWSENFVYFPTVYDGSSDVEYVPRNPCDTKTKPIGGG